MSVHLLLDTKGGYPFIADNLGEACKVHVSPECGSKYLTWLKGAIEVVKNSRKDDLIICVYDFQAVLCYIYLLLTLRRRKILAINVLLKDKNTLRNKLARWLYTLAFKSRNFVATVTSEEYGKWLRQVCGVNCDFPLLKDVCYESYKSIGDYQSEYAGRPYVFCGGRNGRDWNFMLEVAKRTPDVSYKLVMPRCYFERLGELPANVECQCDIDSDSFSRIMADASVIAMPLDTFAPAGLIVIFQSACLNKPIIVTSTMVTRAYLSDGRGFTLENDADVWVDTIRRLMANPNEARLAAGRLRNFVCEECSEKEYVSRIRQIIDAYF